MKPQKKQKIFITFSFICAAFLLLVFAASKLEKSFYADEVADANQPLSLTEKYNGEADRINFDGQQYQLNPDITTLLVMGIDNFGDAAESDSYNNSEQADFLMLVIIDNENKTYTLLHLNRDTMTDVTILGLNGVPAGTEVEQLALAHTYGSGMKDSCENTASAVSNLLYGVKIDYYLSMTMDAVADLNDLIGGVTLTVTDDFNSIIGLKAGETVTLTGSMALTYVRNRKDASDSTNLSRMERQRQYISAFMIQFLKKYKEDRSLVLDAYSKTSKDLVTNLAADELEKLVDEVTNYRYNGIVTSEGSAKIGAEYMEFYVDEAALRKTVVELYYKSCE